MTAVQTLGEQRVLLDGINWEAYEALLRTWQDRRVRLTFDEGSLEIMSPLHRHEQYGRLIGRFVEMYTIGRKIPLHSGGSTTFKKEAKKRGLEPDESYWIQREAAMRGRKDFDIDRDPPPDLGIEIDITSSSLDRMRIYATLGIPEIWRYDGERLTIYLRDGPESYAESDVSRALPELRPADLHRFLELSDTLDETTLLAEVLDWARAQAEPKPTSRRSTKPRRPPKK